MKLTETILRKLEIPSEPTLHSDDAVTNLYLKLYQTGRKTWVFRSRSGGVWRSQTLGSWPDTSLATARQKALDLGERGTNKAMTFGELLDDWFAKRIEPRYAVTKNIATYVTRGKQWLGHKQLSSLTTRELVQKLQTYAEAFPVAANRCLSNWKLALDYGVEVGALDNNPLARTSSRAVGGEEKTRDRVLSDDEIKALWASGETLLRFLLLTGLRISEAQQGTQDGTLWRIGKTKNGDPHWVHCPALALAQIETWPISPTSTQNKLKRWCEREGVEPFTPHDLRRTFATRLAGMGIAPHIVEKCLNHRMQGVMGIYNRHEYGPERIAAGEKWATEVQRLITATEQAKEEPNVDLDLSWSKKSM